MIAFAHETLHDHVGSVGAGRPRFDAPRFQRNGITNALDRRALPHDLIFVAFSAAHTIVVPPASGETQCLRFLANGEGEADGRGQHGGRFDQRDFSLAVFGVGAALGQFVVIIG